MLPVASLIPITPGTFDPLAMGYADLKVPRGLQTVTKLLLAMRTHGVDFSPWPGGPVSAVHGPAEMEATVGAFRKALGDPINSIVEAVRMTLERTPPELSADIIDKGIVLAGGGALLTNLDDLLREDSGLRVAILEALQALEPPLAPATLRPLLKRLATSPDPDVAGRAGSAGPGRKGQAPSGARLVERLVSPGQSPETVATTVAAIARRGAAAIPELVRALEGLGPLRGASAASLRARAALHEALAALDSRVALYDLREALEARPRSVLPALLRAAARIGDASVVPALARAVAEETALLDACAEALAAIVAREKLRKTGAVVKAVRPEHRTAFSLLWERAKAVRPR